MAQYYVAANGSDSNNGTSTATPWQTLAKVNSASLSSGDIISFNKGDTFYGSLTISTNNITLNSYGTGNAPLISGFQTVTNWSAQGGGIYAMSDPNFSSTMINIACLNGSLQPIGRFPRTGYRTYTANNANTSITDTSFTTAASYVSSGGAQLVIRKLHYILDVVPWTGQSNGVLTYTANTLTATPPTPGFGYFVQNCYACMTQLGDWYYNPSTHTFYMYFGANGTTGYTVKVGRYDNLITVSNASGLTITNLAFEGANQCAILKTNSASNLSITNCTFNNIGVDAIRAGFVVGLTVTGCTFTNINNMGVVAPGTSGATVSNNTLDKIGLIAGMGEGGSGTTGYGAYSALSLGSNDLDGSSNPYSFNNVMNNNTITNVGYCGIEINGNSFTCSGNYINNYCTVLDDGAGLYTYVGSAVRTYSNRTISNNLVLNGIGASSGTDGVSYTNGIYLDDNSSQITVSNNTVYTCLQYGLFIHNAHNVTATGNLVYNAAVSQLAIIHDNSVNPPSNSLLRNISYTGNYLIAGGNNQSCVQLSLYAATTDTASDYTGDFTASNNYYASTSTSNTLFSSQLTPNPVVLNTLAQWQTLTGQDSGSTLQLITKSTRFDYNTSLAASTIALSNNYVDLAGTAYNAPNYTLAARRGVFLVYSSAYQIGPLNPIQLNQITTYLEPSTSKHWINSGTTYGWWQPLTIADTSPLYVPYNSATGNVNLGTYSITAGNFIGSLTGNASTVTNGVYTTSFNGLGDARYLQLSGGTLTGDLNGINVSTSSLDSSGYRFFASDAYKINMSSATNATWGGRVAGETTSDYNMYFRMQAGTNRGFVFVNNSTPVAGIDGGGNLRATGDIIASSSSDARLKDNITVIPNALDLISKIGGYSFDWNSNQTRYKGRDYGVIAQEIQAILPELVTERMDGYLAVRYEKLVAILIEAIKELNNRIDGLS